MPCGGAGVVPTFAGAGEGGAACGGAASSAASDCAGSQPMRQASGKKRRLEADVQLRSDCESCYTAPSACTAEQPTAAAAWRKRPCTVSMAAPSGLCSTEGSTLRCILRLMETLNDVGGTVAGKPWTMQVLPAAWAGERAIAAADAAGSDEVESPATACQLPAAVPAGTTSGRANSNTLQEVATLKLAVAASRLAGAAAGCGRRSRRDLVALQAALAAPRAAAKAMRMRADVPRQQTQPPLQHPQRALQLAHVCTLLTHRLFLLAEEQH